MLLKSIICRDGVNAVKKYYKIYMQRCVWPPEIAIFMRKFTMSLPCLFWGWGGGGGESD